MTTWFFAGRGNSRKLTANEIRFLSGGRGVCTAEDSGNDLGGVKKPEKFGEGLIGIYEGLVAATAHVIERVASAL